MANGTSAALGMVSRPNTPWSRWQVKMSGNQPTLAGTVMHPTCCFSPTGSTTDEQPQMKPKHWYKLTKMVKSCCTIIVEGCATPRRSTRRSTSGAQKTVSANFPDYSSKRLQKADLTAGGCGSPFCRGEIPTAWRLSAGVQSTPPSSAAGEISSNLRPGTTD